MTFTGFAREFGKATKPALAAFESTIGMELPKEYRAFVLKHNGGAFDEVEVVVPQVNEPVSVHVLYGIGIIPQLDLGASHARLWEDLPERTFAIGRDPGGNPFLMDLPDPDQPGAVYYWDVHRMLNRKTRKALAYQLTKSFSEFLALLPVKR